MDRDLKVLIIPLDWGLGHATRCVPIIHYMRSKGWKITLAGEGKTGHLLKQEFPDLEMMPLRGYNISYPKKGIFFIPSILMQVPKILVSIIREHRWLRKKMKSHAWDIIVSDNRYGLFHQHAKTIFITHQVGPISGLGSFADKLLRMISIHFIERFNACWVPDTADNENISGILSHPKSVPRNIQYIGPLSRMTAKHLPEEDIVLLLLSGPEPQRSILEKKLIEQASTMQKRFICVRGLPADHTTLPDSNNIQFIHHLPSIELGEMIEKSGVVVCRTGYSSVMDLIKLRKKAVMIPTPGQTEQEYLGKRLSKLGWFTVQAQQNLDLSNAIQQCIDSQYKIPALNFDAYRKTIDQFGIQYFGA